MLFRSRKAKIAIQPARSLATCSGTRYASDVELTVEDLRELLERRRDLLLDAVRQVLLSAEPHPFTMSHDEYLKLPENNRIALSRRAQSLRADWIDGELEARKATWIVVAGDEVLAAGIGIDAGPDDAGLGEMGRRTGKVPFVFSRVLI